MATSPQSMEANSNPLTSWPADSPARISARPGSVPESRDLARAFGLSSPVWFGNLDLDGCSLRTSQASLFTTECDELSENWPDSGMWDAGAVYELQNSEPVTSGSASSSSLWITPVERDNGSTTITPNYPDGFNANLVNQVVRWPTVVSNDAEKRGNFDTERSPGLAASAMTWPTPTLQSHSGSAAYSTESGRHSGTTLTDAIRMWPTARAEDSESCGNHPGAMDSLTGATRLWATPTEDNANNAGGPSRTNGTYRDLNEDVANWPTPNVPNGGRTTSTSNYREDGSKQQIDLGAIAGQWRTPNTRDHHAQGPREDAQQRQITLCDQTAIWQTPGTDSFRSRGGDRKDEMGLDQEARTWITPNARDWKSETGSENNRYNKTPGLSRQVYELSRPDPVTQDGLTSSENVQTSRRRLNPRFVEWLMGFPISWTEL